MQIDRDIPMPSERRKSDLGPLIAQMQIGDSILTDYTKRSGAASVATLHARRAGLTSNFITAMDGDHVRIWRKS